jgi:hypothetical protein
VLPMSGSRMVEAKLCNTCGYFHDREHAKADRCDHCGTLLDGAHSQYIPTLFEMGTVRGRQIAAMNGSVHELTASAMPSVIFGQNESRQHGNFYPASWRNICANPGWARRLAKVHTGSRSARLRAAWRWRELDCANSSDALLMNIFCCRRTLRNPCLMFHAGRPFRAGAAIWIQAGNSRGWRIDTEAVKRLDSRNALR